MGKSEDGPFNGFPFLDHTLIPSRFILKDMFDLTAWEIRVLMFFFYNLYSAIPCRFIDEASVIEKFGSATHDLSDTQKATPNIIRVSLASLVKTGYLNVSKKKSNDGKDILFYSLKLDLRSRAALYNSIESYGTAQYQTIENAASANKQFARIEVLEERDLDAKTSSILKNEPVVIQQKTVTASHFSTPIIIKDEQSAVKPATDSKSNTDSADLSKILDNDNISINKADLSKPETPLKIDLPLPKIPTDTSPPAKDISKEFLSDLEDVIKDMKTGDKADIKNETAVPKDPAAPSGTFKQQPPEEKISTESSENDDVKKEKQSMESASKAQGQKKFDSPEEQRGAEIWEQVIGQMHILLDNMTFNNWLKPSEYYKYKDGVHLIKVESVKFYEQFIKQWGNLMQEVIMLIEPEFKFEFYSD
jgi:hypothetical protein